MAEAEKKDSKGARRYGNPPKIKDKGKTEPAKAEASKEKPGDAPVEKTEPETANEGSAPKPDVMAGTDGIDVQKLQTDERDAMSARHAKAVHQMHMAHSKEWQEMVERHKNHFGAITNAAAPDGGPAA